MKAKPIIALALALALLAGCAPRRAVIIDGPTICPTPPPGYFSENGPVEELSLVAPNTLALKLLELESARSEGKNVILSLLSIEMALAMAANGAAGEAKEALGTLTGLTPEGLNLLLGAYLCREDSALSLANSMWFNRSMDGLVKGAFKDTLAACYGAGEGSFSPYSQADAAAINGWVKEKTHDKIDSIISADALTQDTLALLINALYFNGQWVRPFAEWQVEEGIFHAPDGDQEASLMSERLEAYFEDEYAHGFSKHYRDGYEFIAILPKEEGPVELDRLDIDAFLNSLTYEYDVDILLPKFELEYSASLVETLCALGLGSLFEEGALNGMLTEEAQAASYEAHISDVLHKTYMKMYEEGTEAAAVTAVVVECTAAAMPMARQVKEVFLGRPFAFLIRDTMSGQVVFCGVINSVE